MWLNPCSAPRGRLNGEGIYDRIPELFSAGLIAALAPVVKIVIVAVATLIFVWVVYFVVFVLPGGVLSVKRSGP
jgi:hypothetical protein